MDEMPEGIVIIEVVQEGVEYAEYIYSLFAGFAECITIDEEDIPEYV